MNSQPSSSNKIIFQDSVIDELTSQDTIPDIKYQDIIYYMHNINKIIESKDQIHIDFLKALSEMNSLYWLFDNWIGFENQRTKETLQFIRTKQDYWYAEVLIGSGKEWDGYLWHCYSESKSIIDMLQLFFEEAPWFEMLPWNMTRVKK